MHPEYHDKGWLIVNALDPSIKAATFYSACQEIVIEIMGGVVCP